jgi:ADP-ribosylglycohydrolase
MFGAIVGDIAGSPYERINCKGEWCEIFAPGARFTDDTVLTLATADHFVFGDSYADVYKQFGRNYPYAGYGASFREWMLAENPQPYNSWGNGSAMRVSPIAWVGDNLDWVLKEAKESAAVTHNHPDGIKGAQAVASAVFLARVGTSKTQIKEYIVETFAYDLSQKLDNIRPSYSFDVSCAGSVPQAITAFLESTDFESAIRKAISLGGDSDTIACIAGAIAHAYYRDIPDWMITYCLEALDVAQRSILADFWKRYPPER